MTHPQFTPSLHPRYPAGHMIGGQNVGGKFMPKSAAGSALWAQQVSAALARVQSGAPAVPRASRPSKSNLAHRNAGPTTHPFASAGVAFIGAITPQSNASGKTVSKRQWYVNDTQGNMHGPFASIKAANNYYAKMTGGPVVPAAQPVGPHKVATGKDLIGAPPNQHPNAVAARVQKGVMTLAAQGVPSADRALRAIADMQGFSGIPEVVTTGQITKLKNAGTHIVAYRGVTGFRSGMFSGHSATPGNPLTAAQIQDQTRSGDAYFGKGIYGNGYYFSTARADAVGYSDRTAGSIIRVAIPKTAKIGQYSTLKAEAGKLVGHHAASPDTKSVFADVGRYAAARGYDVIEVDTKTNWHNHTFYVVLNRSILKVQNK